MEPASPSRRFDRWELAAAVILSLATVASAWSGYQAARWSGQKTKANRATAIAQIDAGRQESLANRQVTIDAVVFTSWLEASVAGDQALADEIEARFRDEFSPAFEEWRGPATSEALPPGSPFDEDDYQLAADQRADELTAQAEESAKRADESNQTGDNFILAAVLYASVLFFAGISTKLSSSHASHLAVGLSGAMFVFATTVMLTLPISVGF